MSSFASLHWPYCLLFEAHFNFPWKPPPEKCFLVPLTLENIGIDFYNMILFSLSYRLSITSDIASHAIEMTVLPGASLTSGLAGTETDGTIHLPWKTGKSCMCPLLIFRL